MLEAIKDPFEVNGVGYDDIPPLLQRGGRFSRLVDEILVDCFPGLACLDPSGKGLLDFKLYRVQVLNNGSLKVWSSPRDELSPNEHAQEVSLSLITLLLFIGDSVWATILSTP